MCRRKFHDSLLKEKDKYYPYINPSEETGMCNICRHLNEGYQINRTLHNEFSNER
jgi:hypothetical protein